MSERAPLSREQVVEAIRIHELAVSEGLYESTDLTLMLAQDCLTYMDELATAVEMFNQMFNQANREYGEIAVERDSYMAALEQIAKYPSAIGGTATILQDIARAAIKGKEVSSANS